MTKKAEVAFRNKTGSMFYPIDIDLQRQGVYLYERAIDYAENISELDYITDSMKAGGPGIPFSPPFSYVIERVLAERSNRFIASAPDIAYFLHSCMANDAHPCGKFEKLAELANTEYSDKFSDTMTVISAFMGVPERNRKDWHLLSFIDKAVGQAHEAKELTRLESDLNLFHIKTGRVSKIREMIDLKRNVLSLTPPVFD